MLLLGYVLVSAADDGRPWRSIDAAQKHISTVENVPRISAKAGHQLPHKILGGEMNVRGERTRVAQAETILRLSDVIEIVSQRFTIWPVATELKGFGKASFSKSKLTGFTPYLSQNDNSSRQNQYARKYNSVKDRGLFDRFSPYLF